MSDDAPCPERLPSRGSVPPQLPPASLLDPRVELDPSVLGTTGTYKLLIGAIVPRPIAFISTMSPEGVGNLAPFSFFNGVSSDPPCLMVSITRKNSGEKKDTLRNIEATGQFVVNTVSDWMAEAMNQCSGEYPYGVDEMEKVGLTPLPSTIVRPSRVRESPVHFECELYKAVEVGEARVGAATVVIGRIVRVHVLADAYEGGRIRIERLRPLSRLAGFGYGLTDGIFDIPRPKV
jgi:flavin reductase (DIM6/NTAB) family NADH-FMN oxidoreductase RutF